MKPEMILRFPAFVRELALQAARPGWEGERQSEDHLIVTCSGIHDSKATQYDLFYNPPVSRGTFAGEELKLDVSQDKFDASHDTITHSDGIQADLVTRDTNYDRHKSCLLEHTGVLAGFQINLFPILIEKNALEDFFSRSMDLETLRQLAKGETELMPSSDKMLQYLKLERQLVQGELTQSLFQKSVKSLGLNPRSSIVCVAGTVEGGVFKMIEPSAEPQQRKIYGTSPWGEIVGSVRVTKDPRNSAHLRVIEHFGWVGNIPYREKFYVNTKSLQS